MVPTLSHPRGLVQLTIFRTISASAVASFRPRFSRARPLDRNHHFPPDSSPGTFVLRCPLNSPHCTCIIVTSEFMSCCLRSSCDGTLRLRVMVPAGSRYGTGIFHLHGLVQFTFSATSTSAVNLPRPRCSSTRALYRNQHHPPNCSPRAFVPGAHRIHLMVHALSMPGLLRSSCDGTLGVRVMQTRAAVPAFSHLGGLVPLTF